MIAPSKIEFVLNIRDLKDYLINTPTLNKYASIVAVRTNREVATKLLLENQCLIKGGCIHFFQIRDIGLGVYEVKLRESSKINTYMVNGWESQVIDNTTYF